MLLAGVTLNPSTSALPGASVLQQLADGLGAWALIGSLIALLLGYPNHEPAYKRGRLKGSGVIHYEKFQHLQKNELDEIVRLHDDMTLHIGQDNGWDKKGYKHYLDWFYKEWVRGGKPTTSEGQMFRRLKKSGFVDAQKG